MKSRSAARYVSGFVVSLALAGCGTQTVPTDPVIAEQGGGNTNCTTPAQCPPPPLKVVATTPTANSESATVLGSLEAEFNYDMSAATSANFVVHSLWRGKRSGSYGLTGKKLSFTAFNNFKPGEEIEVSLTEDLTSTSGKTLSRPYVFRFRKAVTKTGPNNGSFLAPTDVLAWGGKHMALGDINGDGHVDAAGADGATVRVMFGNGAGQFASPDPLNSSSGWISLAATPKSLTVADLNKNGKLELITGLSDGKLAVFEYLGVSGFSAPTHTTLESGQGLYDLEVGDLDGDGHLDVAALTGNGKVRVVYGNGQGGFRKHYENMGQWGWFQVLTTSTILTPNGDSLALGDINRDGDLDVIVSATDGASGTVFVTRNNGNMDFATPTTYAVNDYINTDVAVADLTGDGKPEIIVSLYCCTSVQVLVNNGFGSFTSSSFHDAGSHPNSVTVADLNGDNKLDVITGNHSNEGAAVMFGNGLGGLSDPSLDVFTGVNAGDARVRAADADNDGDLDLFTIHNAPGYGIKLIRNKN
jgi:hypothetical protein